MPQPPNGDRCPFERPFPRGFQGCPAYQPRSVVVADSLARPMGLVASCQFLTSATGGARGRYYAQCSVGTASDRRAWADRVSPERAALVRSMREELERTLAGTITDAFLAKTLSIEEPTNPLRQAQMAEVASALTRSLDDFIDVNLERLENAGISTEPLRLFVRQTIEAWRTSPSMEAAPHDPAVLEAFPPGVRELLVGRQPPRALPAT